MAATNPIFIDFDETANTFLQEIAEEWLKENEVNLIDLEEQIKVLAPQVGVQLWIFFSNKRTPKELRRI